MLQIKRAMASEALLRADDVLVDAVQWIVLENFNSCLPDSLIKNFLGGRRFLQRSRPGTYTATALVIHKDARHIAWPNHWLSRARPR